MRPVQATDTPVEISTGRIAGPTLNPQASSLIVSSFKLSSLYPEQNLADVYRSTESRGQPEYDEYDAGDDDDRLPGGRSRPAPPKVTHTEANASTSRTPARAAAPKEVKQPVVQDLFDFGDDDNTMPVMTGAFTALPAKQDDGEQMS
jgi:hypothetical protein